MGSLSQRRVETVLPPSHESGDAERLQRQCKPPVRSVAISTPQLQGSVPYQPGWLQPHVALLQQIVYHGLVFFDLYRSSLAHEHVSQKWAVLTETEHVEYIMTPPVAESASTQSQAANNSSFWR